MIQDPSLPTGYAGKMLLVDLENRKAWSEPLAADDALELVGGYGIGAKFLYLNQRGGVDPLGPENWLGFTTGPLTGSSLPMGSRWTVVTKSPLTGTWGDANAGGWFGHRVKAAGYDAIFCRAWRTDRCICRWTRGRSPSTMPGTCGEKTPTRPMTT